MATMPEDDAAGLELALSFHLGGEAPRVRASRPDPDGGWLAVLEMPSTPWDPVAPWRLYRVDRRGSWALAADCRTRYEAESAMHAAARQ